MGRVKWVHNIYIKQQNWWEFQAPSNASWIIKYLCKVKEELKTVGIQTWDTSSKYKLKKVYKLLLPETPKVNWGRAVWNRMSLPKHRFILWLSTQNRLKTKERLQLYGISPDDKCCIYAGQLKITPTVSLTVIIANMSYAKSWNGWRYATTKDL